MKKQIAVSVMGALLALAMTVPVSAHHGDCAFGHHDDGQHDCYITMNHFCEIARDICDYAGYCMDDHSRGYCNQSCQTQQTVDPDNGYYRQSGSQSGSGHHGNGHHREYH